MVIISCLRYRDVTKLLPNHDGHYVSITMLQKQRNRIYSHRMFTSQMEIIFTVKNSHRVGNLRFSWIAIEFRGSVRSVRRRIWISLCILSCLRPYPAFSAIHCRRYARRPRGRGSLFLLSRRWRQFSLILAFISENHDSADRPTSDTGWRTFRTIIGFLITTLVSLTKWFRLAAPLFFGLTPRPCCFFLDRHRRDLSVANDLARKRGKFWAYSVEFGLLTLKYLISKHLTR